MQFPFFFQNNSCVLFGNHNDEIVAFCDDSISYRFAGEGGLKIHFYGKGSFDLNGDVITINHTYLDFAKNRVLNSNSFEKDRASVQILHRDSTAAVFIECHIQVGEHNIYKTSDSLGFIHLPKLNSPQKAKINFRSLEYFFEHRLNIYPGKVHQIQLLPKYSIHKSVQNKFKVRFFRDGNLLEVYDPKLNKYRYLFKIDGQYSFKEATQVVLKGEVCVHSFICER